MAVPDCIINKRYVLGAKLGSGSFGILFKAIDKKTYNNVALKFESVNISVPQLAYEFNVYLKLNKRKPIGIPKIYNYYESYRLSHGKYNILVMDLLGNSLQELLQKCGGKFSLKTLLQIAIQLIDRIKFIHDNNYIHRDIKPDNFVFHKSIVYLVDFGLAKQYRDPKTHLHMNYKENKRLIGTPRYTSINTHLGIEQSRRDDLESIGYVLIYLFKGILPWQGIKAMTKNDKYSKILKKKLELSIPTLCKGLPHQFISYFEYVKTLKFNDKPDYEFLKELFIKTSKENSILLNNIYDWDLLKIENDINQIDKDDGNPKELSSSMHNTKNSNN